MDKDYAFKWPCGHSSPDPINPFLILAFCQVIKVQSAPHSFEDERPKTEGGNGVGRGEGDLEVVWGQRCGVEV